MRLQAFVVGALVGFWPGPAWAQEKPVPADSMRLSIPGCSRGVVFTVVRSPEHESRSAVAPGRRFRLAGPKALLDEIKAREGTVIEVTGLVRKGQLDPAGIPLGGGVRIGPAPSPVGSSPGRDPNFNQIVLDVEGWRALAGECPSR